MQGGAHTAIAGAGAPRFFVPSAPARVSDGPHGTEARTRMSFRCPECGEVHDDLPDIASDRPDQWWGVPEEERERRTELTSDTCVIDGEHFFIRGVIEIPVHDHPHRFGFGVWVSLKRENFETYLDNWESSEIGPFFGWLSTRISYYPQDTRLLKTRAHFRACGLRPSIELEPTEHPLAVHQREGITLAKAWEIAHFYMDPADA